MLNIYDDMLTLSERLFEFVPLWGFRVFFRYNRTPQEALGGISPDGAYRRNRKP